MEYLVLHDIDLIIFHVENNMHTEEIQEDEDDDVEGPGLGKSLNDCHPSSCSTS